jgi:PII-like signaling protein
LEDVPPHLPVLLEVVVAQEALESLVATAQALIFMVTATIARTMTYTELVSIATQPLVVD